MPGLPMGRRIILSNPRLETEVYTIQYRDFGNIGIKVSVLGFGAMRLSQEQIKGKLQIKHEESVEIIQRAFELGVNYVGKYSVVQPTIEG